MNWEQITYLIWWCKIRLEHCIKPICTHTYHGSSLEFLNLFPQKLISWVFNDQPRRECAVVALMAVFRRQGEGTCEKKWSPKVIAPFPLSKIAHWSILLRGNGVFFIIADPAAELGPHSPHDRPHSPHDRPHSLHDRPHSPLRFLGAPDFAKISVLERSLQ